MCCSNTCKSRIVISRCRLLAALVFWVSAVICFGGIRKYLLRQKGNSLHLRKGILSSVLWRIWVCNYFCTSIHVLTVLFVDISWHISIELLFWRKRRTAQVFSSAQGMNSAFSPCFCADARYLTRIHPPPLLSAQTVRILRVYVSK